MLDWTSCVSREWKCCLSRVSSCSEEAMRKAGTAHNKSSTDMENHVFIKAKSRVSPERLPRQVQRPEERRKLVARSSLTFVLTCF